MRPTTKLALLVLMVMAFMPAAGNASARSGSHVGIAAATATHVTVTSTRR